MKQFCQIAIVITFIPLLFACTANPTSTESTEKSIITSEANTLSKSEISTTTEIPLLFDTITPITPEINTPIFYSTNTIVPQQTDTTIPLPTDTTIPLPTDTTIPLPTDTSIPIPTDTMIPATSAPVPTQEPQSSGCPDGCTTQIAGCNIKGNISTKTGEKIYHLPGMEYYTRTKISPEDGERWFCTEAEAVANGWRKAKTN